MRLAGFALLLVMVCVPAVPVLATEEGCTSLTRALSETVVSHSPFPVPGGVFLPVEQRHVPLAVPGGVALRPEQSDGPFATPGDIALRSEQRHGPLLVPSG